MASAAQINYYKDPGASGANDGSSPTDAWQAGQYPTLSGTTDGDVYIWYRRNTVATYTFLGNNAYYPGPFKHVHAAWPKPGDPLYDIRPGAGIAAGWDADPLVRPKVNGYAQLYTSEIHGIHLYGWNGVALVYTSASGVHFYDCHFEQEFDAALEMIQLQGSWTDKSCSPFIFKNCEFTPKVEPLFPVPNPIIGIDSRQSPGASVQFINCIFNDLPNNDGNDLYKFGLLCPHFDGTWPSSMKDVLFLGCTFPNKNFYPIFNHQGTSTSNSNQNVSPKRLTTRFVGCNFQGGKYVNFCDHPDNVDDDPWILAGNEVNGNRNVHLVESSERIDCINDGWAPANSERYMFNTAFFTLYDDPTITTPGDSDALVLITNSRLESHSQCPRLGISSRMFISPLQQWPSEDEFGTWFVDIPASTAATIKIQAMCRGWSTLPTNMDFYFFTYNTTATGVNANAKMKFSSGQFAANDVWTEFTIDWEACTFDTYAPIFFIIKRDGGAGESIVIDPTLEVV